MKKKCETCKMHQLALKEPLRHNWFDNDNFILGKCCKWYVKNIVKLGKPVSECTHYIPINKRKLKSRWI